jgi:hypothetical protein
LPEGHYAAEDRRNALRFPPYAVVFGGSDAM